MKKYYKDYKPVTKVQTQGQLKQEVEYIGSYYYYKLTKEELKKKKIQYGIHELIIAMILLGVGFLDNPGNRMFYVVLPYVGMFLPTAYSILGVILFIKSKNKMEYATFDKSRNRIYRSTIACIILGIMTIVGDFCFILLRAPSAKLGYELGFLAGMIAVVALSIHFLLLQKKVVYDLM